MFDWSLVLALLAATAVLLMAHVVRAARWAILFSAHDMQQRFHLLLGLALGYAANSILPFRLGELFRVWYVSRQTPVRFSYVAATVVAERTSDLLVVASLLLAIHLSGPLTISYYIMAGMVFMFAAVVGFSVAIQKSEQARRYTWRAASVFNDDLRFRLIDFFWSVSELVTGGVLLRGRYLAATGCMWALYSLAYLLFANAVAGRFDQVFIEMIGSRLRFSMEPLLYFSATYATAMAIFAGVPIAVVIVYGFAKQWPRLMQLVQSRKRYGWYASHVVSDNARTRFKAEAEYIHFLASLFSGHNKAASHFGMEALDNCVVHKLYGGGSDAITALVEVGGQNLVIRKFASGQAGRKLQQQKEWLTRYRVEDVPLVEVIGGQEKKSAYYYDMPLVAPANDFFDFIHSNPTEKSRFILSQVLDRVSALHDRHHQPDTAREIIHRYLAEKATDNAVKVLEFARALLPGGAYTVNGRPCHLDDWNTLLDPQWLSQQIELEASTIVHGDLTIENIIVAPQVEDGWYIIDPNPENVFNSPLIDWAKMLQSLNLGYEAMNRNFSCSLEGSNIQMAFTRSQAYTQLHQFVEEALLERFGERGCREAYFHQLVHYLRLLPYKIRQNPQKGVAFFACTSVLLQEYRERWNA